MQPGHGFDRLAYIFLNVGGRGLDGCAVFDDEIDIDGGFLGAQLHLHATGNVLVAAEHIGDAAAGAHSGNSLHLVGRNARDDGDDFIGICDRSRGIIILIQGQRQIILFGGHIPHLLWIGPARPISPIQLIV